MNDDRMPAPSFPGMPRPGTDFQAVRDQRRAFPQFYLVDLSVARSIAAGTQLNLPINGNSFYCDPIIDSTGAPIGGVARVVFQDQNLSPKGVPFTVASQFIARIPFTNVILENPAQPGKFLQINYGVDIEFQPGINAQVSISGTVAVQERGFSYGATFVSTTAGIAGTSLQLVAPGSNVNGMIVWNAEAEGRNTAAEYNLNLAAHTAAPNNMTTGDILATGGSLQTGATNIAKVAITRAVVVPAGRGLFRNTNSSEATSYTSARITLL